MLAFVQVDGMTKIVCAIGLILFAGMTIYDAQSTRALLTEYEAQGPEMVKKISILCALTGFGIWRLNGTPVHGSRKA